MNDRREFIDGLVNDLGAPQRPPKIFTTALFVAAAASLVIAAMMLSVAPFRPGVGAQLFNGRFALESALGLAAAVAAAFGMLALAVPGRTSARWPNLGPAVVIGSWLVLIAVTFVEPIFAPSMLGKRPLCYVEVLIYGFPLAFVGLWRVRRLLPLRPALNGAWVGMAAGLVPAWLMQLACMHEPAHIVSHHLLPVLAVSLISAGLGAIVLRHWS